MRFAWRIRLGRQLQIRSETPCRQRDRHFLSNGWRCTSTTSGTALANVERSLELGVRIFDSAVGGLGGCPFAPGAPGNLGTERLIGRMEALGLRTGADAYALAAALDVVRPHVHGSDTSPRDWILGRDGNGRHRYHRRFARDSTGLGDERRRHANRLAEERSLIMEDRAVAFLRRLLDAPGPSGYESAPARVWREEAAAFADEVTHDVVGNSFARVKPRNDAPDAPKVLLAGHIDEIGFVITHIDKEGFLWFAPLGGWDEQVVVGQRLRVVGRQGDVIGVIGKKAAHLLKDEDRRRPTRLDEMWIDIGARDFDDAARRVDIGTRP